MFQIAIDVKTIIIGMFLITTITNYYLFFKVKIAIWKLIVHYFSSYLHEKYCIFASILLATYKRFNTSTNWSLSPFEQHTHKNWTKGDTEILSLHTNNLLLGICDTIKFTMSLYKQLKSSFKCNIYLLTVEDFCGKCTSCKCGKGTLSQLLVLLIAMV